MERKFIDLRITAISDEDLKDFLIALRKIQYCGDVGANRLLPIQIDGDGSGGINIEMHEKEIGGVKLKNLREIVNLDENKTKNVDDSHDFETHYIGEQFKLCLTFMVWCRCDITSLKLINNIKTLNYEYRQ